MENFDYTANKPVDNFTEKIPTDDFIEKEPMNDYLGKNPIHNYTEKIPIDAPVDRMDTSIDLSTINLNNKVTPLSLRVSVDVTDTYMALYNRRVKDKYGRYEEYIAAGLFKKNKVFSPDGRRQVQGYVDVLTGFTAGLLLDKDGKDIVASQVMENVDLLPSDYGVAFYSSLMQKIEEQYGIKPFHGEFVGLGLIRADQFDPTLKGEVPLTTILEKLKSFGEFTAKFDRRIADPMVQRDIEQSLLGVSDITVNRPPLNEIDLSSLPEDFNKIKH